MRHIKLFEEKNVEDTQKIDILRQAKNIMYQYHANDIREFLGDIPYDEGTQWNGQRGWNDIDMVIYFLENRDKIKEGE